MIVAVAKETYPGERRVALAPASLPPLLKAGYQIQIESGAGDSAGYPDQQYLDKGATVLPDRRAAFQADVVLQVRTLGANLVQGRADLDLLRPGQVLIGMCDPLGSPTAAQEIAERGATLFGLELIPRITRAQSMDVLSSMATITGYKAVLLAANNLPRMFPMLMTAAGTVTAAKAFIIGAGVAGLQAIASCRRLGAVVQAYDTRPAVREQCESLGAKFVELPLEAAEGTGGYAKQMDEEFYRKQRELMASVVAQSDICITTAAIPGKKSPLLITAEAVQGMQPGSVIVDLAAERGGNCELTRPDEIVVAHGVTILGPTNLPSEVPYHASQMFGKNVANFLLQLGKKGEIEYNLEDEITRETLVARGGEVVQTRLREMLNLPPLPTASQSLPPA
jgi:NAD(P) transhydrogenase subunit alpha